MLKIYVSKICTVMPIFQHDSIGGVSMLPVTFTWHDTHDKKKKKKSKNNPIQGMLLRIKQPFLESLPMLF